MLMIARYKTLPDRILVRTDFLRTTTSDERRQTRSLDNERNDVLKILVRNFETSCHTAFQNPHFPDVTALHVIV